MKEYIRWAKKSVENALKTRRVIIISGARQVGKTTLTKQSVSKNAVFRTLDDTNLLDTASQDPKGFLEHKEKTLVIDEIQKAPILLPTIKMVVDKDNAPGQFVLTGSSDVLSNPNIKESLAGRVKNIRLRGLTEGEIRGSKPTFIEKLFKLDFPTQIKGCSKSAVLEIALRGGYPEIINFSKSDRKSWHKDYLNSLIEHDLKDIANIKNEDAIRQIIKILSAWSSKYMDINGICSSCGISKPTVNEYISLIERMYLCERLHPWTNSDYKMIGRTDKMYMTDTGLMATILGWHYDDIHLDADKYGKLIETYVFNELSAQIDLNLDYTLHHYRDRRDKEIDFIIENDNGDMVAVEVKGGSRVTKDDFNNIVWFKENLAKEKKFKGVILYSDEDTITFGKDLIATPIANLWI